METKVDLRDDAGVIETLAKNLQRPISYEMGEQKAKDLGAVKYVECSALTQVDYPDSKVYGTNMGPTWGRQDPGGSHVGPMILATLVAMDR